MKQNPKPKINQKKNVEYEQKIGELTEALQRLQAEFENYKKRQMQESAEAMVRAKEMVLSELLPALDNFDLASSHLPAELEGNSWAQGMQYVGQQLTQKLDEIGVKKIIPIGEEFDHNMHEAIEHVTSDKPEGIITDVITPGYQIGDRVVRPARVKVSGGSNNSKESNKGE
jgi:molecular chaperone GrpE